MKRSGVNGCWTKSIAREHCGTKLTSFSALAATKWDSACRKAPKKGKILPLACHYCCPTMVTEKRSAAQSMSGGGVPIRSGKKATKTRPRKQSKCTLASPPMLKCISFGCAFVFMFFILGTVEGLDARKWIRDSDQRCTPRFLCRANVHLAFHIWLVMIPAANGDSLGRITHMQAELS